jgi:hypothetical protein
MLDNTFINDEIVFNALGFEHLDSMDYSNFEYATIIHDLNNTKLPTELVGKYDFIVDGGTIEHVFNFWGVMENIFNMLKIGGTFFFDQPTFFGFNHGYYNFSPCLYYEYFKANNYKINNIVPYAHREGFVWMSEPIINNIYGEVPLIENSRNLIWGSVTKTIESTFNIIPYQGRYTEPWNSSNLNIDNVNETLYSSFEGSTYLYGTGKFVREKLPMLPLRFRNKIAGLLSPNVNEVGKMLCGYKIYALEDINESCHAIIIATSKPFQDIVYDRIKHLENKGIKIVRFCV